MEYKQVVIRRSLFSIFLFIIGCAIFVVGGIFLLPSTRFLSIITIIFFGVGGLFYVAFMALKPIAVVSSKGIMVPYARGEIFVPWENVERFELIEQTVGYKYKYKKKYIGIFAANAEGIVGANKILQAITQSILDWREVPALLIDPSLSAIKIEIIMEILQKFYDEYRNA